MFSSLSILPSSASTSSASSSASSAITEIFDAAQSQIFEEKIPLTSKEKTKKKLASMLTQIRQNQVKHLDLTSASLGRFYELAHTLSGHESVVCSLAVLKNGTLASGSNNPENTIKLWDLTSESCLCILRGHAMPVYTLAVFPNGQLASGSVDNTIKLWDWTSNSCLSTLDGHMASIYALAVLPNGQLASGSSDSTIKLWDLGSRSCLSTLQGHTSPVLALAVLPNGQLASGSSDSTIKLWDLGSHSCLSTLQGHTNDIFTLTVLPNGHLASGSRDQTIKLWDLPSNSCLCTLQGHTGSVYALGVLPNGQLASGSSDSTIKLWDLSSHSCFSTLRGHTGSVYALTVLPDGQLASGSWDSTIKIWTTRSLSTRHLRSILKGLRRNTSAMDLDLSGNQDILDDFVDSLVAIFTPDTSTGSKPNISLKTIDLRRTGVSKEAVKKLKKAIYHQRLSIKVLADCSIEWKMIYFLIIFCRANRNSPFSDSGLDLCKHGEIGSFLGVSSGFFSRLQPHKARKIPFSSKRIAFSWS